jgi:UDP-N-acetylglucosamine 2-epimerase (non-hydrolysing)
MQKIFTVIGTRPEAIKMAPVILALKKEAWADVRVVATAQHRDMLDQVVNLFGIEPDFDLNVMQPNQALATLTSRIMLDLETILSSEKPAAVLIQGDTTTVMATALACFYHRIPVGHVEAGLRTWDMNNPFPEEANRVITGKLASWHFSPTEAARQNLLKEGVHESRIFVTGNTVIDALLMTAAKNQEIPFELDNNKRLVLITAHRRENFGAPFRNICRALQTLAKQNPDTCFLYPVHPNPNIRNTAHEFLRNLENFVLCEPLDYSTFIAVMKRAYLILTDSGGVQEEAPALGKPVLVLRDETERPEAISQGVVKLAGTSYEGVVECTQALLDDAHLYASMARGVSPYGDGCAAARIVNTLRAHFS